MKDLIHALPSETNDSETSDLELHSYLVAV